MVHLLHRLYGVDLDAPARWLRSYADTFAGYR